MKSYFYQCVREMIAVLLKSLSLVHIKNILVISLFLAAIAGMWGCKKDHSTSSASLSPDDSCWNLFARDSNYRKGKWLQVITDSASLQVENPDTLWFISDSLMGWSFPCCDQGYLYTHFYLNKCNNFICQSWDSTEQAQGKWYYRWEYLNYATNTVSIVFQANLSYDTVSFKKIQ